MARFILSNIMAFDSVIKNQSRLPKGQIVINRRPDRTSKFSRLEVAVRSFKVLPLKINENLGLNDVKYTSTEKWDSQNMFIIIGYKQLNQILKVLNLNDLNVI